MNLRILFRLAANGDAIGILKFSASLAVLFYFYLGKAIFRTLADLICYGIQLPSWEKKAIRIPTPHAPRQEEHTGKALPSTCSDPVFFPFKKT